MKKLLFKTFLLFLGVCLSLFVAAQDTSPESCTGLLPSIPFKPKESKLSNNAKSFLTSIASKIKQHPQCILMITLGSGSTKAEVNLCFRRGQLLKQYLIEREGIISDRINIDCTINGDPNTADFRSQVRDK